MLITIILVSLSMAWLGYETKWFTIRLLIGKDKSNIKDDWTPYYKELLENIEIKTVARGHVVTFTPIDMPKLKGTLNILCREIG